MYRPGIAAITLALALGAAAQGPPKNAVDITNAPASAAATAPLAVPVSNVIRVYVDTLNGADASAVQGLLTQALFESQKVVITENQGNANLIIKGRVLRQALAPPASTSRSRSPKRRGSASQPGGSTDASVIADLTGQTGLHVTNLDAVSGTDDAGLALLPLNVDSTADLSHYNYRLDLRLLSPDGDLVWMSGQGPQATPFAGASGAVAAVVTPMLAAIVSHHAAVSAAAPGGSPLP